MNEWKKSDKIGAISIIKNCTISIIKKRMSSRIEA